MDSNGLADPYVKLHLLPGASKVPYGLGLSASQAHRLWRVPSVPSSEPKIALSVPKPPASSVAKSLQRVRGGRRAWSLTGHRLCPFLQPRNLGLGSCQRPRKSQMPRLCPSPTQIPSVVPWCRPRPPSPSYLPQPTRFSVEMKKSLQISGLSTGDNVVESKGTPSPPLSAPSNALAGGHLALGRRGGLSSPHLRLTRSGHAAAAGLPGVRFVCVLLM